MIDYSQLADLAKHSPLDALQIASKLLDNNKKDTQAKFIIAYIFLTTNKKGLAHSIYNDLIADLRCIVDTDVSTSVIGNKEQLSQALNMLSQCFCEYYESEAGHEVLNEAIVLTPDDLALTVNKSLLHLRQNEFSECIALCSKVLEMDNNNLVARQNIAQAYLSLQNYKKGFKYYRSPDNFILDLGLPELAIKDLHSDKLLTFKKTVIVTGLQGLGDQVLFSSCVPLLQEIYKVKMVVDLQLVNLFKESFNLTDSDISGELRTGELPGDFYKEAHYQLPMCQLFKLFISDKSDLNKIDGKYLKTGELLLAPQKLRVGIAWTGGLANTGDKIRSLTLDDLAPILAVQGVDFYSLEYIQPDQSELDKYDIKHDQSITGKSVDYKLTAQLINSLDLVITVPTTATEVSGALETPCLVINPFSSTFRTPSTLNYAPFHKSISVFNRKKDDSNFKEILKDIKEIIITKRDIKCFSKKN